MRTTEIRFAQHIGRGFNVQWMKKARRKITDTGVEDTLANKGVAIFDPKAVLTPIYNRPIEDIQALLQALPPKEIEEEQNIKPKCYLISERFSPPGGVLQAQKLINGVIRDALPDCILNDVKENSSEEDIKVQEAILHAHLFDSHQEKLPRVIDVINRPGWSYPMVYGAPVRRKNNVLTYRMILLLDQLFPKVTGRNLATKRKVQVQLNNSGNVFYMKSESSYLLSSSQPLQPVLKEAEVNATVEESLPSIHPFSPFLHVPKSANYANKEYGVLSNNLVPHTIYIHMNMPRMPHTNDSFTGITLLKAFTHAAAYAKQRCKIRDGILEKPLRVQVIHTNGIKYHIGVLQLNTLNLTGDIKNVFWHHPIEELYDSCSFQGAEGKLEGYNPKVFSLLKALHLQ